MAAQFTWNGAHIQAKIEREFRERVRAAAGVVQDRAKALVSTGGATQPVAASKVPRSRRGRPTAGAGGSRPGEPPHRRTGRLLESIVVESDGLSARVGASVAYASALERGTARMAARPFLQRALAEAMPEIRRILTARLGS